MNDLSGYWRDDAARPSPAASHRFAGWLPPRMWPARPDPASAVLAIIAGSFVLRLAFAAATGLGVDESYMVAAGRHLQLSYFDHPPLGWWLAWAAAHLLGSDAPIAVRLPFILLFSASIWLMYRLTAILFSRRAGMWAAIAFNLSPVFGVTSSCWVLPDGPLITALLGAMICIARATDGTKRAGFNGWWLGAGLCAGAAMLSKYTAILPLAGVAIAILTHSAQRRLLAGRGPWLAAGVAAVMFLPVIIWNAQHGWCSVAFQGGRAFGSKWHPLAPLTTFGGEALFLLPWIWLVLIAALIAAWRRGRADWPGWLLACAGTPALVLFAAVGVRSHGHVLFHWADCGYLMLFPLAGALLARRAQISGPALPRLALATACLVVAGAGLAAAELRWNWLQAAAPQLMHGQDPGAPALDWAPLLPQMRARGWIGPGKPAIAALRWHTAGKLDYALGGAATVLCLGPDPREYGLIQPVAAHDGEDVLIVAPKLSLAQLRKSTGKLFAGIEPLQPLTLREPHRADILIPAFIGKTLSDPVR
jgi:hypothetical protein